MTKTNPPRATAPTEVGMLLKWLYKDESWRYQEAGKPAKKTLVTLNPLNISHIIKRENSDYHTVVLKNAPHEMYGYLEVYGDYVELCQEWEKALLEINMPFYLFTASPPIPTTIDALGKRSHG